MAFVYIKKSRGSRAKTAWYIPLLLTCLTILSFLIFGWSSGCIAQTRQNDAEVSLLDLKWLSASPSLLGFDKVQLESAVSDIGRMNGIYSVIVVRNNFLILQQYFREGTRLKPHNLKSATKSVLSALTGIAVDKGYLRLDQPISDFLPQVKHLADPRKADITVRHLLTMTSGLEPTSYQAYNSWIMNGSDWVRIILNRPLVADPGTKHQYSTGDTHILSAVLTGATRMSTREFAERNLFNPLGITVKGWEIDPQGINQGGNNLSLIPLDMAMFGQLYLDNGSYRNRQIIPKWWVEASTRPNYLGEHEDYGYYGYLWYSRPRGADAFVAVGYGGQYVYVSPEYKCVIVITSTLESKGREWEKELFGHIQDGILASIEPDQQQLLQVAYNSKSSPAFLQDSPTAETIAAGESSMALATANLNLRSGPSRSNSAIKLLDAGTVLEVLAQKESWLKVQAVNLHGWVAADYVRFINPERIRFARHNSEAAGPAGHVAAKQPNEPAAEASETSRQDEALDQSRELVRRLQDDLKNSAKIKKQLQDELAEVNEKLAAARQSSAGLETEHKALNKKLAELHTRINLQQTNIQTVQADRDSLQAKLSAVQKELAKLQELRSQSEAAEAELQKRLAVKREQLEEAELNLVRISEQDAESRKNMEQELTAARTRLKSAELELQEAHADNIATAAKLAAANKELESQHQASNQSEAARKKLELQLAGVQGQLDSQTGTLTTVQFKRDMLQTELSALQQEMAARQERIADSETQQKNLEAELAAARMQLAELEKTRAAALDQAVNEQQKLAEQLAAEQEQVKTLHRQMHESRAKAEETAAELAQANEELKNQVQASTLLEETRKTLQAELADMQMIIAAQQEAVEHSASATMKLESELAVARDRIESLTIKEGEIVDRAENTRRVLEEELAAEREQSATLEKELRNSQTRNTEITASFARLEEELENQRQKTARVETARKSLANELSGMQNQLETQTGTLTTVQSKRDTLKAALGGLQEQLVVQQEVNRQAVADRQNLEKQLTAAQSQIEEMHRSHSDALVLEAQAREKLAASVVEERAQRENAEKLLQEAEAGRRDVNAELAAAKTRVGELTQKAQQLSEVSAVNEQLQLELAALQTEMAAQQEIAKQTEAARKALAAELTKTQEQMSELGETQRQLIIQAAKTRNQLESDLAAEQDKLNTANTRLQASQDNEQELTSRLATANSALKKQQQETAQAESDGQKLKAKLAEQQTMVANLDEELKRLQASRESLQEELAGVRKTLADQKDVAALADTAKTALEAELATAMTRIKDLQESQNQAAALAAMTQKQMQELQTGNIKLTLQLAKVSGELEAQQQAVVKSVTYQKQLELELLTKNSELTAELVNSRARAQELQTALADAGSSGKDQAEEYTLISSELAKQRRITDQAEALNRKLAADLTAARKQVELLQAALKAGPPSAVDPEGKVAKMEPVVKYSQPETIQSPVLQNHRAPAAPPKGAKLKTVTVPEPVEKTAELVTDAKELPDLAAVDAFVGKWAQSWEQKNVEAYLSHYSRDFSAPGGLSLAAWKKQRHQRLGKPKFIKIDIHDLKKNMETDTRAQVTFIQKYNSDTYGDQVAKTLDLIWEDGSWAIAKETSKAL